MALTINHNAMAQNAHRNLSTSNNKLATSVQRMSSGLRINSAADDAAGLAIREIMRSDIAVTKQGIRNAADAISMIQTADGSLGIIDEKLVRMKELAEQAATGTYTTVQRDIINSEYQAMAAEIDRIANATNFNGIKLLDGSVSNQHGGQGIKIHFGVSNNESEDYYFVNMGDARATSSTGLQVGGDAKNDIWGQGAAGSGKDSGPGCCTAGFDSLNGDADFTDGQSFSYGYNWDWKEDTDENLDSGKYLAGRYEVSAGESLQDLVNKVNDGTQSRVGIAMDSTTLMSGVKADGTVGICIGDEAYIFGSAAVAKGDGISGYEDTVRANKYDQRGDMAISAASKDNLEDAGYTWKSAVGTGETDSITSASQATSAALADLNGKISGKTLIEVSTSSVTVTSATLSGATLSSSTVRNDIEYAVPNFWADEKGNFTSSEDVAKAMGFQAVNITYDVVESGATKSIKNVRMSIGEKEYDIDVADSAAATLATSIDDKLDELGGGKKHRFSETATQVGAIASGDTSSDGPTEIKIGALLDETKKQTLVTGKSGNLVDYSNEALAEAINSNTSSEFWAMTEKVDGKDMLYVFSKEGGDNNDILACDVGTLGSAGSLALNAVQFENVASSEFNQSGTNLSLGGEHWATMKPVQTKESLGDDVWNVNLIGRDVGSERDIRITNPGDITTPGMDEEGIINGMNRASFIEIQNADDAPWAGAEVRTQSSAQEALDALTEAIVQKDKIRADLGAMQNRLENTMSNLEIQAENLQASESRISDVDVAMEMTEFTKNNAMTQAATSMLAQANSMSSMALSLIG